MKSKFSHYISFHRVIFVSLIIFGSFQKSIHTSSQLLSSSYSRYHEVVLVAGNFSLDGKPVNIAQYDMISEEWSTDTLIDLFLYGESNGVIWDIAVNQTIDAFVKMYVVGAFDTVSETSQIQYCSVGGWNGDQFDKVGEGLCPRGIDSSQAIIIKSVVLGNEGDMFVGGSFESRVWDGRRFVNVFHVAQFDGMRNSWLPLGGTLSCSTAGHKAKVQSLAWDSGHRVLYIGGEFDKLDDNPLTSGLAMWTEEDGVLPFPGGGVISPDPRTMSVVTAIAFEPLTQSLFVSGQFNGLVDMPGCGTIAVWYSLYLSGWAATTSNWTGKDYQCPYAIAQLDILGYIDERIILPDVKVDHIETGKFRRKLLELTLRSYDTHPTRSLRLEKVFVDLFGDGDIRKRRMRKPSEAKMKKRNYSQRNVSAYSVIQSNRTNLGYTKRDFTIALTADRSIKSLMKPTNESKNDTSFRLKKNSKKRYLNKSNSMSSGSYSRLDKQSESVAKRHLSSDRSIGDQNYSINENRIRRLLREGTNQFVNVNDTNSVLKSVEPIDSSLQADFTIFNNRKQTERTIYYNPSHFPTIRPSLKPTPKPTILPTKSSWVPVWDWLKGYPGANGPILNIARGQHFFDKHLFIVGAFNNYPTIVDWHEGTPTTSPYSSALNSRHRVQGLITSVAQVNMPIFDVPASEPTVAPVVQKDYTFFILLSCVFVGVLLGVTIAIGLYSSSFLKPSSSDDDLENEDLVPNADNIMVGIPLKTLSGAASTVDFRGCFERAMRARHLPTHESLLIINPKEIVLSNIIGEGSFGRVWSGRWRNNSVAVKEFVFAQTAIVGGSVDRDNLIEEIVGEAGIMACLRHPKILQLYGCSLTMQAIWIVSELCSRGSLRMMLNDKNIELSLLKKVSMCLDVADGMMYLHTRSTPIIHRDLKSHNILITEPAANHFVAKIGDWGSARAVALTGGKSMTHGVGTACWLAPEVIDNAHFSKASDVYAFGIVLWEVFTRSEVYEGLSAAQIISKVAHENLRPKVPKDCPWNSIMTTCWSGNPAERPSFSKILQMLSKIYSEMKAEEKRNRNTKSPTSSAVYEDNNGRNSRTSSIASSQEWGRLMSLSPSSSINSFTVEKDSGVKSGLKMPGGNKKAYHSLDTRANLLLASEPFGDFRGKVEITSSSEMSKLPHSHDVLGLKYEADEPRNDEEIRLSDLRLSPRALNPSYRKSGSRSQSEPLLSDNSQGSDVRTNPYPLLSNVKLRPLYDTPTAQAKGQQDTRKVHPKADIQQYSNMKTNAILKTNSNTLSESDYNFRDLPNHPSDDRKSGNSFIPIFEDTIIQGVEDLSFHHFGVQEQSVGQKAPALETSTRLSRDYSVDFTGECSPKDMIGSSRNAHKDQLIDQTSSMSLATTPLVMPASALGYRSRSPRPEFEEVLHSNFTSTSSMTRSGNNECFFSSRCDDELMYEDEDIIRAHGKSIDDQDEVVSPVENIILKRLSTKALKTNANESLPTTDLATSHAREKDHFPGGYDTT